MEKERIQKIIAESGYCSRRKAEELITRGKVMVNGHPAVIGQKLDAAQDRITVEGTELSQPERNRQYIYLMMNKPRGYLTAMSDDRGRRCVTELLPELGGERVYPIGRLDLNSEGILLFTNDGDFANDMMHPSRQVSKCYRVTVQSGVTDEQAEKLATGVYVDGRITAPAQVRVISKEPTRSVMEITIREGRNRQIRKMCEDVGLTVARLKRNSFGPIRLGMLKPGGVRELTKEELRSIRSAVARPAQK